MCWSDLLKSAIWDVTLSRRLTFIWWRTSFILSSYALFYGADKQQDCRNLSEVFQTLVKTMMVRQSNQPAKDNIHHHTRNRFCLWSSLSLHVETWMHRHMLSRCVYSRCVWENADRFSLVHSAWWRHRYQKNNVNNKVGQDVKVIWTNEPTTEINTKFTGYVVIFCCYFILFWYYFMLFLCYFVLVYVIFMLFYYILILFYII